MSLQLMMWAYLGGGAADVLTLSGESLFAGNDGSTAVLDMKLDDDGKMYERANSGSYFQFDTNNDWLRPISSAPGTYQVRFTTFSGDALDSSTAAEDVWHALSGGDFVWTISDDTALEGPNSVCTFTVELREGTGPVLASGSYTMEANRIDS